MDMYEPLYKRFMQLNETLGLQIGYIGVQTSKYLFLPAWIGWKCTKNILLLDSALNLIY